MPCRFVFGEAVDAVLTCIWHSQEMSDHTLKYVLADDRGRPLLGHTRDKPDGPLRRGSGRSVATHQLALSAMTGPGRDPAECPQQTGSGRSTPTDELVPSTLCGLSRSPRAHVHFQPTRPRPPEDQGRTAWT